VLLNKIKNRTLKPNNARQYIDGIKWQTIFSPNHHCHDNDYQPNKTHAAGFKFFVPLKNRDFFRQLKKAKDWRENDLF
jgi:hypothetical protein